MDKKKIKIAKKRACEYSLEERQYIIDEYISSGMRKSEIWKKYTGSSNEHGNLIRWMRQLGYEIPQKYFTLEEPKEKMMSKPKITTEANIDLKKRIKELEKALIDSELRASAYDTMITIAEKELKINIRKKSYTKQSIKSKK